MKIRRMAICFFLSAVSGSVFSGDRGGSYLPVQVSETGSGFLEVTAGEKILLKTAVKELCQGIPCQQTDIMPVEGGVDILVTYDNQSGDPADRGGIDISGIRLGDEMVWLDGRAVGVFRSENLTKKKAHQSRPYMYPRDLYSPVITLADAATAVGVSVLYDILEVKANLTIGFSMVKTGEQAEYTVNIRFGAQMPTHKPTIKQIDTRIPPHTKEQYRIAVRFSSPDQPLATLEPYRRFFRSKYGDVQYEPDLRPVFGWSVSNGSDRKPENPQGFAGGDTLRADLNGWKPTVDKLLQVAAETGYRRIMLWKPSGTYETANNNFPSEFMSVWPKKMVESAEELKRFRDAGITLGYWWGNAGVVSGGWDTGVAWPRDITNPADIAAGEKELELVKRYYGDEVGLDAYSFIPLWERLPWTKHMQRFCPEQRFITEPADCDILHTITPTFCVEVRQDGPAVLANWLNPGHETWLRMRSPADETELWFNRCIDWGMVPLFIGPRTLGLVRHDPQSIAERIRKAQSAGPSGKVGGEAPEVGDD